MSEKLPPADLAFVIRQHLLGVAPEDQDIVLGDEDWETILAALALLSQSPEGMGWQPIETAPKDGTPILILDMNGESIEITEWCTHKWTDYEHVEGELYRKVETESTYWNGNGHRATHWMPLPPPPAVSSHSQGEEMGVPSTEADASARESSRASEASRHVAPPEIVHCWRCGGTIEIGGGPHE